MTAPVTQTIQLENPVAEHFKTFISANSAAFQVRALVELQDVMPPDEYEAIVKLFDETKLGCVYPQSDHFRNVVEQYLPNRHMVQEGSAKGQHLVLCGAGPTLRKHAKEWCGNADQVWGCNSAAVWLADRNHRVTHAFSVDQTPQVCAEWKSLPQVEYLLASTVHPHLTQMIQDAGLPIKHFHNFVGLKDKPVSWPDEKGVTRIMPYEEWLYTISFPPSVMAGSGLNSVTRALDIALYMGFEKITVLGADCCLQLKGPPRTDLKFGSKEHLRWLRKKTVMHADGGHALASEASPLTLGGYIDGRYWLTKADMSISAQWLMKMAKHSKGKIELIGDTLPNALMDKDDAFLARLPNFVDSEGRVANLPVFPPELPERAVEAK